MTVVLEERKIICDRCRLDMILAPGEHFSDERDIRLVFQNPNRDSLYWGRAWRALLVLEDTHDICPNCVESDKRIGSLPVNCDSLPEQMPVKWIHVLTWHPEKDGEGKPEQVHLVLDLGIEEIPYFAVRLKSRDAVNRLIEALETSRNEVWPEPGDWKG